MNGIESFFTSDQAKRQAYGAYYTPLKVASILVDWAIKDRNDLVLEPCFGGCDFLEAIRNRFESLGQQNFDSNTFGCDIDPEAFSHLSSRLSSEVGVGGFIHADFLRVAPSDFRQESFDVVIGNPPYIKNDRISNFQRESIQKLAELTVNPIKGRANLWAYFVVHALTFLREGGRMAFVLPGNFLTADYSGPLKQHLSNQFISVKAISVSERLFLSQGTEERTVVLLCDGFKLGSTSLEVRYCSSVVELENMLSTIVDSKFSLATVRGEEYLRLSQEQEEVFINVASIVGAEKIERYGVASIGIVLGDKKFFVRSMSDWRSQKINKTYICPIVSKFSYLKGIQLRDGDIDSWEMNDNPCYFLNTRGKRLGSVVLRYLDSNVKRKAKSNSTFERREKWHQPDDGRISDAFIGCISHLGPRLILNSAGIQGANSVYRFEFNTGVCDVERQFFAISFLTTFSQLSAELTGRPLGSGGLKIEPRDVSDIFISMKTQKSGNEISVAFEQLDSLLRSGEDELARLFADEFVLGSEISKSDLHILSEALVRVRNHRHRDKQSGVKKIVE